MGGLALGLACFALWRVVEAITDADRHGGSPKGLAIRGAHLLSGATYAGLALAAIGMALGERGAGNEDAAARSGTAWLLAQPFGRWAVALIGVAVIGTGIGYAWRSWKGKVTDRLSLPPAQEGWIVAMGRLGFAARAVVFSLIGGFLIAAAWHARSAEVRGLGGALDLLRQQPYGVVLLALTATGLAAFGAFGLVQARYRRVDAPDLQAVAADVSQRVKEKIRQ